MDTNWTTAKSLIHFLTLDIQRSLVPIYLQHGILVAGIGMAIIAMLADRLIQAWSKKRQSELGIKPE